MKTESRIKKIITVIMLGASLFFTAAHAQNANISKPRILKKFAQLDKAGILLTDSTGKVLLSEHADKPLVPASTTKLVTAWLALQHWGENYHFTTHFYLDRSSHTLWVKGSGDPFLVSEELQLIARSLKQRGLQRVDAIGLDTSLFEPGLVMPGTATSNNPYDAVPSAVAANFNTVNIKKVNGKIRSAEPQTPLTPYARSMGKRFSKGTLRVNTGPDPRNAERYFAELLGEFLKQQGISVAGRIINGPVPATAPAFYAHRNSRSLAEVIKPMMKYSTNFIANQLVLVMAAETSQRPANAADVQRYMEQQLGKAFHWRGFSLRDGAGLSRANRLSPRQLVELLQRFKPWRHLLPEVEPGVYAKSGTLNRVSTLAGYLVNGNELKPFALMMNQAVPYKFRNRIARELASNF